MTREELEEEIRARMNGDSNGGEIEGDICQNCSSLIDEEPYVVSTPEHGEDIFYDTAYCDESCYDEHITSLIERE